MEAGNSILRKRKPLSDCTNTLSSLNSSVASSSRFKPISDKPNFTKPASPRTNYDNTIGSTSNTQDAPNPASVSERSDSTPPPPRQSSALPEVLEPCTVYTRRRSAEKRDKGKAVDGPLTRSAAKKRRNIGSDHNTVSTTNNEDATNATSNSELLDSTPPRLQSSVVHGGISVSKPPFFLLDVDDWELPEPCTVYTRRRGADKRDKGKAVEGPLTRSAKKRRNIGSGQVEEVPPYLYNSKQKDEAGGTEISKRRKHSQRKKKPPELLEEGASKDALNAYIEEQRAYFAAIDAEKLEEEDGSDN